MILTKLYVDFSAKIFILRTSELKRVILKQCLTMSMSILALGEPKASAKATGPISFKFSRNLFFQIKYARKIV